MAPSHPYAIREVCYNIWLDAFDDCLLSKKPRQKAVFLTASEFLECKWTETTGEVKKIWNQRSDSWRLPTSREQNLERCRSDHHCVWVGWFLPALYVAYNDQHDRDVSKRGCVNNTYDAEPLTRDSRPAIKKAFKVVYKPDCTVNNRLFALHSPDENGLCKAVSVPGGAGNVLFFSECRDDWQTGPVARRTSWLRRIADDFLARTSRVINQSSFMRQHDAGTEPQSFDERRASQYTRRANEDDAFVVWEMPDWDDGSEEYQPSEDEEEDDEEYGAESKKAVFNELRSLVQKPSRHARPSKTEPVSDRTFTTRKFTAINSPRKPSQTSLGRSHWLETILLLPEATAEKAECDSKIPAQRYQRVSAASEHARLSQCQPTKRQLAQFMGTEPVPSAKRSRPSQQAPAMAAQQKLHSKALEAVRSVPESRCGDDDDEVQFLRESPVFRGRKKTNPVTAPAAPAAPLSHEGISYVVDFISAGKMAKVARLPDATSRRATLKAFRKHLLSTTEAGSDALARNIAENEDEVTRVMLAEALVADLDEKLTKTPTSHSFVG
ncbi:hypothetical protein CTA1_11938 [Colletotrichum tanaceti]|uniref:Uncharacterized protein n=1 Tax=Colletotrichum tanaceti TaxID=1306861 RepID=A0A4U6XKY5_9PEZI|nr:hypothetical protein CTA1_11938 [Colletotrichum tanaceti]